VGKEVYPNAPLSWVTAEIRYPQAPRLRQQQTLDQIQIALETLLPIGRSEHQLTLQIGPGGSVNPQEQAYRLLNRASTASAVIGPQALTVETTSYRRSEDFLSLVRAVVDVVLQRSSIPAVERIGLRYINEVRVPDAITRPEQWQSWVAPVLLNATEVSGGRSVAALQGIVQYETDDQQHMTFRYGTFGSGTVVGNPVLKRADNDQTQPFFLLDLDSFWEAMSPESALAPDSERIAEILDSLHEPISDIFEGALTDRLRQVFRRE
jgi:uncharacterized protein (TIGR04255 family)